MNDNVADFDSEYVYDGEETPDNNVFELHQRILNSYDSNNKTCLEVKTIASSEVEMHVYYMICFENIGADNAINIVVKDIIIYC